MSGKSNHSSSKYNRSNSVKGGDRWARLEAAVRSAQRRVDEAEKHGKVRIIVRNGKPVDDICPGRSNAMWEIEEARKRLKMSEAEVLQLAREIAPGCGCGLRGIVDLTQDQRKQLYDVLEAIERSGVGLKMRQRDFATQ